MFYYAVNNVTISSHIHRTRRITMRGATVSLTDLSSVLIVTSCMVASAIASAGYRGKFRTAVFRLRTAVLYRGIPRLDQNI